MTALTMQRVKSAESTRSASSRPSIEYYMRPESRLSSFQKVPPQQDETRAQYGWRLIRQCVREAVDFSLKADIKDLYINHGIHHHRKIMHIDPIQQMVYNKNTNEYITLDGKLLRIYHPDGRKKEVVTPNDSFNRLIYASGIGLFVGWSKNSDTLLLMNDEFEVQSRSQSDWNFLAAVYNENIGEIVTTGPGNVTSWVFRYGGRHILPRKTCTEGLTEKDEFHLIVLEETISRTQKAYAACGSAVAVFNLFHGQLLAYKRELHVRNITALLFFNPLKYLITAAKDGSIKVWDEKWHLQLVFVGHCGPVTSLAIYPFGPNIMSSSLDKTLRVWSLETCDEVDVCETGDCVNSLTTIMNHDKLFTTSTHHADLWSVQNVHMLHTCIGHRVQKVKVTDHPEHMVRNVLLCKDASVRVVSPSSGDVITTLLQQPKSILIDAAYAIHESLLYACFMDGHIVKADTSTNPATVLDEWPCIDHSKACNYLLVYEYVITADVGSDMWGGIKRMAATKGKLAVDMSSRSSTYSGKSMRSTPVIAPPQSPKSNANKTLLLGGRKDGHICVFNMQTGEVDFEIEAHGTFGVLSMIANSKSDQLISSGLDNLIKIWRLYPYAQESLAPLMTLYCAHTPTFMCILKNKLAVAFQEPSSAIYSVVMYSLKGRNRFDHQPDSDHIDTIVGLTSCPKLKIVASASHDGTVKIWNDVNSLIRVIKLNAKPYSISFCSEKGDLLLGIAEHVHKIDYKQYMPKSYRFKMISLCFNEIISEKALPFDDNLLNLLSKEDQKRLKAARSSFKFTHFVDILTEDETEEVVREKREKETAFNSLLARDEELQQIRDGLVSSTKKPPSTAQTKREGFEKYLKIFYDRPKLKRYEESMYAEDDAQQIVKGTKPKLEAPYKVEKEPTGFFPPSSASRNMKSAPQTPSSVIRADGFIPNSVLAKLLFGKEEEPEVEKKDTWKLQKMSKAQLDEINATKESKVSMENLSSKSLSPLMRKMTSQMRKKNFLKDSLKKMRKQKESLERTLVLDYSDEDEGTVQQKETQEQEEQEKAFRSRMKSLVDNVPTPPREDSDVGSDTAKQESKRDMTPVPTVDVLPPSSAAMSTPSASTKASPPKVPKITKFVSTFKPVPPPPRVVSRNEGSARPESSVASFKPDSPPPRLKTPIPDFIRQFIGLEWFDKYFPNANENLASTFPKPWSVSAFVTMLVRILRIADFRMKTDVLEALHMLHLQEGISNPEPINKVLYSVFNHHTHPPTCVNEEEKAFICKGLQLLQIFGIFDRDFYVEHLVQFLEGNKEVRSQVMQNLEMCGLKDPQKYFVKELDSWDVWSLEDKDRQYQLRKMCRDWLERWMSSFKIHIEDAISRMKRGQALVGRGMPNQATRNSPAPQHSNKGKMKKPSMPGLMEEVDEEDLKTPSGRAQATTINVTLEKPPDASLLNNATYIEAINYFCEMELEKSLDALRGGHDQTRHTDQDKNTVLVLPKIPGKSALVRLGETHTSKCKASRETLFSMDLKLPPVTARGYQPPPGQLFGFPSCIQLPLNSVMMNPFPAPLDMYDPLYSHQQPVLLMLKTSQKYFVHQRSYLPADSEI